MILEEGSKVLIIHRRLFEGDNARFFVGVVDAYEQGVAKVRGHTWIRDSFSPGFFQKHDRRTKIASISSGTLLVYELPSETEMGKLKFSVNDEGKILLTDGNQLMLDLSESERAPIPPARQGR